MVAVTGDVDNRFFRRFLAVDPEEPLKKSNNPLPDTPEKPGVAEFVKLPGGAGDFFGAKVPALEVFLKLIFQLGKGVVDSHHHGVDSPPTQIPGRLKPSAPGDKLIAVVEDDRAHLTKPFHAVRQGRNIAHVFAKPFFYNNFIQGNLHRNTSYGNYTIF
jgi:hypothetical protein